MHRRRLMVILLLLAIGVAACSFPGEEPAREWIKLLDKHRTRLVEGEFNAESFRLEGEPIALELARHIDEKSGNILLPEELVERWREANTEFEDAAKAAQHKEALAVYRELAGAFTDFSKQPCS